MLQALRKRLHNDEEGFTLIELMVVVLIIAILIAIAIPTFLGAKNRAQHRQQQSNLRNGLAAGRAPALVTIERSLNQLDGYLASDLATDPFVTFAGPADWAGESAWRAELAEVHVRGCQAA